MIVKIKKLHKDAVVPKYAHDGDAGMDLTAVAWKYDSENDAYVYHTGLAMEIPEGHVGLIFPRSSNCRTNAYLTNSVGVIDSIFRGEIKAVFKNRDFALKAPYEIGERIAQIIIMPYPKIEYELVDELSDSERGEGGYGSTGK